MKTLLPLFALLLTASPVLAAGRQLTGPYTPAASSALAPAEAQKQFALPIGFEARLFAAEPQVVNPVAMTWDARHRLWAVEFYEATRSTRWTKPRHRIKILEDTMVIAGQTR